MKVSERPRYQIVVDPEDDKCLAFIGKEVWPDEFASDNKSIAEIIVNAANYANVEYDDALALVPNGKYFTHMDRVLWVEPRHPSPNLRPD